MGRIVLIALGVGAGVAAALYLSARRQLEAGAAPPEAPSTPSTPQRWGS